MSTPAAAVLQTRAWLHPQFLLLRWVAAIECSLNSCSPAVSAVTSLPLPADRPACPCVALPARLPPGRWGHT
jgi:hypothetical protein